MNDRDLQALMFKEGSYTGDIDGDIGPKSRKAIDKISGYFSHSGWLEPRVRLGVAQYVLNLLGYEPGGIDGKDGPNTREAFTDWRTFEATGAKPVVDRTPLPSYSPSPKQIIYPRQRDMQSFYGTAGGDQCTAGNVILPFAFRIAWDLDEKKLSFACHEKLAKPFKSIFDNAAAHYGEVGFRRLGLDLFGGCYNYRNMRGGTSLSTHAYGAAYDVDPERNQLRWGADRATLDASDYDTWWSIVEAQGAVSLGRAANRDWMHFQFARL